MMNLFKYLYPFAALVLLIQGCATIGSPNGGAKDTEAPKISKIEPANLSTNFKSNNVEIQFDEFIKLKNLKEQLFISPPIEEDLNIRVKGKGITFDIPIDSLRSNTTYSIQLGNAVVDVNEGNPYENLSYIFSTGHKLDSLGLSGSVKDAFTGKISKDRYTVQLYRSENDSAFFKEKPNYVARTSKEGTFELAHLSPGNYQVFAFTDKNGNGIFEANEESIAFLDSMIQLTANDFENVADTINSDSIDNKVKVYGLRLKLNGSLQQAEILEQKIISKTLKDRRQVELVFAKANLSAPEITLIEPLIKTSLDNIDASAGFDTINIWFTDSVIIKSDTVQLAYLAKYEKDATISDTLLFRNPLVRKKPGKKDQAKQTNFWSYKASIRNGGGIKHTSKFHLVFNAPIKNIDSAGLHFNIRKDTIWAPTKMRWHRDSLDSKVLHITGPFQPEKQYQIVLDSASMRSIYNEPISKSEMLFVTSTVEAYGNLKFIVEGVQNNMVLELLNEKGNLVRSDILTEDSTVDYNLLNPGKYSFRLIEDVNGNGKWDPGNLSKRTQPEKIHFYALPQDIRENWDLTQTWKLNLE